MDVIQRAAAGRHRWGVLGPGRIAHTFVRDLLLVPDAELVAVGSRSLERARAFADEHGAPSAYASYEELAADPQVEVVYVASPHALHVEHVTLLLEAGKHVLCEKPMTLTADDAEQLFDLAAEKHLFLMEAMWTACHPVVLEVQARLAAGDLGAPRHLHAELGFRAGDDPDDRLLDPALGAGVLLDMGIYPLTLAHLLLGEAEELTAFAALSDRGIDLDIAITGRYPGGALATMTGSLTSWSSRRAEIATSTGRIVLEEFHHPAHATFLPAAAGRVIGDGAAGEPVRIDGAVPVVGRGYTHEIDEVHRCLDEGLLESPLVPRHQTLTLMRQMDRLREQVGVRYPGEAERSD